MEQNDNTPWRYKPDGSQHADPAVSDEVADTPASPTSAKSVSWEAAEFIEHHHPVSWYLALAVATAALAALVFFIAKDYVATGIIVVLGIIVAVFANQKPNQAKYEISDSGLSINGKNYPYSQYKSFTVVSEGQLSSVNLFPLKRLLPPLSAYFDPKDETRVTDALGNYLPYEERKLDSIERLSRRLRL